MDNHFHQIPRPAAIEAAVPSGEPIKLSRRSFLTTSVLAGGGLLLELTLPMRARAATLGLDPALAAGKVTLIVGADDSITLIVPGGEMGQGVNGALAQILSEELPLDLSRVKTVPAPFGAQYGNGPYASQVTGGSWSVRGYFEPMLDAGATARAMFIAAAAARSSAPESCRAVAGHTATDGTWVPNKVVDDQGGEWTYGQLAAGAAVLRPAVTRQSMAGNYQIIGNKVLRPDIREKVDGSAVFGLDVRLPGMRYAAVRHAPTLGAKVSAMSLAPAGMQAVNLGDAVAVVASNSWQALKAVSALAVNWTAPTSTALTLVDTSAQTSNLTSLLSSTTAFLAEAKPVGSTAAAVVSTINAQPKKLNATYSVPMLAHAYMEVLNCTVEIVWADQAKTQVDRVNVWCPTQAPDWVANTVVSLVSGIDRSRVSVTTVYMGGGFGRKIEQDYVAQAVKVALQVKVPVKLMWSREEDFARDYCRPAAVSRVQAGLAADGTIKGWYNRIAAPSALRSHGFVSPTAPYSSFADGVAIGSAVGSGDEPMPYADTMERRVVDYVEQKTGFATGFWRSVGQSISCFVVESAIDECALLAGVDPCAYRRRLLAGNPAMLGVLNDVAALSGWGTAPPANTARGIAVSPGFGSHCALVAEVTKVVTGTTTSYRVSRIFVSVDCGTAVNPDQVISQIQGGVLQGMNAARWNRMKYDKGICQIKNFGDYKIGKLADAPEIIVRVLDQGSPLGGVGEVGVPPVAPALANAYVKLTGVRKRALPLGF
jgi:isoquinoline 1-oxidoreductase beta subunit